MACGPLLVRGALLAVAVLLSSISGVTDNREPTTGRSVVFSEWLEQGEGLETTGGGGGKGWGAFEWDGQ